MFPSTQPMDGPDDLPTAQPQAPAHTALTSLSPSLLQDLMRFEPGGPQRELLEVLAACLRHTQPLAITLAVGLPPGGAGAGHPTPGSTNSPTPGPTPGPKPGWRYPLVLSAFPLDRLVHCTVPLAGALQDDLPILQVLQVQPATWRPPGSSDVARVDQPERYGPLGPWLWAVALRGARDALLPELAGQAAYRVSPGASLGALEVPGAMAACITRLRRQTCNLREIAGWPGVGPERATRLLNALYLQSALIVSRTHPAATNEGWTGY